MTNIGGMRRPYNSSDNVFLEEHLEKKEPFHLFNKWFEAATKETGFIEANSMCLATATKEGIPSARMVLLKGYSKDGFIFFTHYTSRKGDELDKNPVAALCFHWSQFNRSVRIEGNVEKIPFSDADEYFRQRPYSSQIGALCSNQSKPIEGRHVLLNAEQELKSKFSEGNVPRPPLWGGYIVKPHSIEFWQGQTSRIHDRIRFRKPKENEPDGVLTHQGEDGWVYERLAP